MGCCGQSRRQWISNPPESITHRVIAPNPASTPPHQSVALKRRSGGKHHPLVTLVYKGASTLTVIGPITGRRYRFKGQNASVAVDASDAPSLLKLGQLQKLSVKH